MKRCQKFPKVTVASSQDITDCYIRREKNKYKINPYGYSMKLPYH